MTWAAFLPSVPALLWQSALTTRGFTGHEQLDAVGLIHMNGRVYDPQLGRFLSADPFVQDASNLQALNPYSYVQNNPLSFTDPTGHFLSGLFKAIGHFFSSIFRAIEHAIKAVLSSSIFRAVLQIAACAFGTPIGCVAAAGGLTLAGGGTPLQAFEAMAFAGVSMAVWNNVGNILQGASSLARTLVHGVVNGALRMAQGGSFLNGFAIGAAGEGADIGMKEAGLYGVAGGEGKFLRASIAGVAGGTASVLTGGKFANGAVSAAFANLFNDQAHGTRLASEEERNQIMNDPTVKQAMSDQVAKMDLSIPAAQRTEQLGFWVYQNNKTGDYFTVPMTGSVIKDSEGYQIDPDFAKMIEGATLVASAHAHPLIEGDVVDGEKLPQEYTVAASKADIKFLDRTQVMMIIFSASRTAQTYMPERK